MIFRALVFGIAVGDCRLYVDQAYIDGFSGQNRLNMRFLKDLRSYQNYRKFGVQITAR